MILEFVDQILYFNIACCASPDSMLEQVQALLHHYFPGSYRLEVQDSRYVVVFETSNHYLLHCLKYGEIPPELVLIVDRQHL